MADNIRGTHVSPGIYSKETDITYAVKSLGITTLGLVGETVKGPAFQPMMVENWRDFQNLFGGTSAEKFIGSQYPKYELPYIAKSYLSESNQLQVCRVLGLSGYNAGPAWIIKANNGMVVAVLRSRGHYEKYHRFDTTTSGDCSCPNAQYDKLVFDVGTVQKSSCNDPQIFNTDVVKLGAYVPFATEGNICDGFSGSSASTSVVTEFAVNSVNFGKFKIYGLTGPVAKSGVTISATNKNYFEYSVTLNPGDKDYILKVLGTSPFNGTAPLYVESLYDVALQEGIKKSNITSISATLEGYNAYNVSDYCKVEPITNFLTMDEAELTKKYVGTRWLATESNSGITAYPFDYETKEVITSGATGVTAGKIYTVRQFTQPNGQRVYCYGFYTNLNNITSLGEYIQALDTISENITAPSAFKGKTIRSSVVKNNYDGRYYRMSGNKVYTVLCDLNNYKDAYRYASTPWFVSNLKGDAQHYELNKLFRFHTISDGNVANNEIKVSIQNIRPNQKTFDVVIRDINDTDESVIVLEKYANCTLTPGDSTYIAYKIGSFDGIYEAKSKYVTVEVNENLLTQNSVPAGFLGYPLAQYDEVEMGGSLNAHSGVTQPTIQYRVHYNQDVKHRRQYFGLSNSVGVDIDMFTYKGQAAYGEDPLYLSQGFHLDSRLESMNSGNTTVDGVSGYTFDCVPVNEMTSQYTEPPVIDSELNMQGSIFENVDLRKFTAYFYGGFDGWDIYREARTNTDEFKINKYEGDFNTSNGEGYSFNRVEAAETLGINQPAITSDWYAYLAGIRQFANPEEVDINVFATPGIDIINNTSLVEEVIEMIEEERADSIYVVTTPDKPFGAEDYLDEMFTPSDIVYELEDTNIDSNYTCTYYPWVKYHDKDNNKYIFLPPTKDVVRNMAMTDNTAHPWFAPAGISRGDVNCVRAKLVTKLADEDVLYSGRINPVKTFASDGVKIWGQKNLQIKESQLNRIAVRRLLLRLRKLISISCIGLIFEPNDPTTKQKFLSTVTPIFDNIKSNRGISDYRIEINDSPESRDRRELPVKLYFKPYQALEYITLDFIVTPESVSFDSI
jgi:hypothetical protein